MGNLNKQLKKYLKTATPEQLKADYFKIQCITRGIDYDLPDAENLLKKQLRKEKWESRMPKIRLTVDICTTSLLNMGGGMALYNENYWLFLVNISLGSYFMHKTLKDSKELW